MGDGPTGDLPRVLRYEELLEAAGPGEADYPQLDEREAAALCYSSGTTGNPKGVLYSHRSMTLHSAGALMAGTSGSPLTIACWSSCRCSTSTPGGSRTRRR